MVLEGLKFKKFASETITHARDSTFAKDRLCQNHVLLTKCAHLVYTITKYALNRNQFSLKFFF